MVISVPKSTKSAVKGKKTALKSIPESGNTPLFTFLSRHKNPEYEQGLIPINFNPKQNPPFESCLIHDKSDQITSENGLQKHIKTVPKWTTNLAKWEVDQETGEMVMKAVYETDDFKSSNNGKIKTLDKFCKYYQPLYEQKKISMFFLTFTAANEVSISWKHMIDNIIKRFRKNGTPIRGYVWTAEVSENLHFHYHICIAIDRINIKKIPKYMKFDGLWGKRTEIAFVRKNVRHYMAKYFAKHNYRISNTRSYGTSKKYL